MNKVNVLKNFIEREDLGSDVKLYTFWEHTYMSLSEDARLSEYNKLKALYFKLGVEYTAIVSKDREKLLDDNLLKQYVIKQRKLGIQMIAAARDTEKEEEAKTFESQQSGTSAGETSVTNIQFKLKSGAGIHGTGKKAAVPTNFFSWVIMVLKDPEMRKTISFNLLIKAGFYLAKFLIDLNNRAYLAKKADIDEDLSNRASTIIGKPILVGTVKGVGSGFSYLGNVIIRTSLLDRLNKDEIMALILYIYGASVGSLKRGFAKNVIYMVLATSTDLVATFIVNRKIIESYNKGGTKMELLTISVFMKIGATFADLLLFLILKRIGAIKTMLNAVDFVKSKGYLSALRSGSTKSRYAKVPMPGNKQAVAKHMGKLMDLGNVGDQIKRGKTNKVIDFFNKTSKILPKYQK